MSEKTAVQWLVNEIAEKYNFRFATYYGQEIQKALEMEKEQISEAYRKGVEEDVYVNPLKTGEEYYNEIYGGEQ
jgi:uncharacterized protein YycO